MTKPGGTMKTEDPYEDGGTAYAQKSSGGARAADDGGKHLEAACALFHPAFDRQSLSAVLQHGGFHCGGQLCQHAGAGGGGLHHGDRQHDHRLFHGPFHRRGGGDLTGIRRAGSQARAGCGSHHPSVHRAFRHRVFLHRCGGGPGHAEPDDDAARCACRCGALSGNLFFRSLHRDPV